MTLPHRCAARARRRGAVVITLLLLVPVAATTGPGVLPGASAAGARAAAEPPDTVVEDAIGRINDTRSEEVSFRSPDHPRAVFDCTVDAAPVDCPDGWVRVDDLASGTHELTAAARAGGLVDPTPARWSWTVPLDDRGLEQVKGSWLQPDRYGPFDGTLSVSTTRWAVLATDVVDARRLVLLAERRRGQSRVVLRVGGNRVGTFSFRGRPAGTELFRSDRFEKPRSGRVRIIVNRGARAAIDGLAVVTAPPTQAPSPDPASTAGFPSGGIG